MIKRLQKELVVWGILWLPLQSIPKEGSLGFYIHKDLLSLAFKRMGRAGFPAFMSQGLALNIFSNQFNLKNNLIKS